MPTYPFGSRLLRFAIWYGVTALASATVPVDVAYKPSGSWKTYPTRTLDDLPTIAAAAPDTGFSPYGGMLARTSRATGFFRTEKIGDRWWLVDPAGSLFVNKAVVSVTQLRTAGAQAALRQKYGNETQWAAQTNALLREHGFNGLGAWSDTERLTAAPGKVAYTRIWNFMSSYGKKRGGTYQLPGHTGYPKDCIFVFDPEFETFCDEHARQLAAGKDDPWLFGHFSDNELPFKRETLVNYLSLPATDPGHQAALAWLRQRHGANASVAAITDKDRQDFLAVVVERYFRIVGGAIRKYDPNHLFLGSRFHGAELRYPEIFCAAGPHLDVVAVNYYSAWTPDPERMALWVRESGKPFLATEWYAKGMDAGLANTTGAGWTVKTQADRGRFYENFTLGLLANKGCVGWQWFKYIDNDPADTKADPSNTDSNKGIVSNRYEPYAPLLAAMKRINERAYALIAHFDNTPAASATPAVATAAAAPKFGVTVQSDIAYLDPARTEKADLYLPEGRPKDYRSPAMLMIHGGGWTGGDKAQNREKNIGRTLAGEGYVCLSINYQMSGVCWPANLHDCKNAVRFLRANAARYQIDPDRIAVLGGSAGGHLALMVAYTGDNPEFEPAAPYPGISSRVAAVINLYGITNLLTRQKTDATGHPTGAVTDGSTVRVFGATRTENPALWRAGSPVTHVTPASPPTLILHGRADTTVDYAQAEELARVLQERGVPHELILLDGVGHTFDFEQWGKKPLPRDLRPDVLAFLAKHLRLSR
ncbi:MAG: alpha/beta hydrolase [Opitutae bacterium]|nr:alpha/beta hydrolase [Opitutae bacterium]